MAVDEDTKDKSEFVMGKNPSKRLWQESAKQAKGGCRFRVLFYSIMVEKNSMVFSIRGNGNYEIPFKAIQERERMS